MDGLERLPVLCSRLGLCSRSEAVHYIGLGLLSVDGRPVRNPAAMVSPSASVALADRGKRMQAEKVTIALHKPLHYAGCRAVAGTPLARSLLVPDNRALGCRTRQDPRKLGGLSAADALDESTAGLLLYSQDGRIATRVSRDITLEKEYRLLLPGGASASQLVALRACLAAEAAQASRAATPDAGSLLGAASAMPVIAAVDCYEVGELLAADQGTEMPGLLLRLLVRGLLPSQRLRRSCALAGLPSAMITRTRIGRVDLQRLPVGYWTVIKSTDVLE